MTNENERNSLSKQDKITKIMKITRTKNEIQKENTHKTSETKQGHTTFQ